jgi:hypothetical protein
VRSRERSRGRRTGRERELRDEKDRVEGSCGGISTPHGSTNDGLDGRDTLRRRTRSVEDLVRDTRTPTHSVRISDLGPHVVSIHVLDRDYMEPT